MWLLYKVSPYGSIALVGKGWKQCYEILEGAKKNFWFQLYTLISPKGKRYKVSVYNGELTRVV